MPEIVTALTTPPWGVTGATTEVPYSALHFRRMFFGMFSTAGSFTTSWLKVRQHSTGADFNIEVTAGDAIVGSSSHMYYAWLPITTAINLQSFANPSATRNHAVYLSVYNQAEGSTDRTGTYLVVTEDANGSGAPLPSGNPTANLLLANVQVAPGQANISDSHITDLRTYAKLRADMQQSVPTVPTVYPTATGRKSINIPSNADSYYNTTSMNVTFPGGRFSNTPRVSLTQSALPAGSARYLWKATNVNKNGFEIWCYSPSATTDLDPSTGVQVDWIAIQDQ